MPHSSVPVRIGEYRLDKNLGIGSFGKVKLAEHELSGHKVAVKILNRAKIKSLDMGAKVKREIQNLKSFNHPHIVRLYEVISTPSDIFLVMEYAPGGELFDYIVHEGRLAENTARQIFQQIVSGVEYCHHHKVVHRDLKPENLLLDQFNQVKIADFGLSNMLQDGNFLRTSCGSPNYAAPEVISGCMYAGPEVDVWSCGVILYALLCGSLPFDDESIPNLFKKIKGGHYKLPGHLSSLAADIIPRMLVVDPMKRITIPEIRRHPWFRKNLPKYLAKPPKLPPDEDAVVAAAAMMRDVLGADYPVTVAAGAAAGAGAGGGAESGAESPGAASSRRPTLKRSASGSGIAASVSKPAESRPFDASVAEKVLALGLEDVDSVDKVRELMDAGDRVVTVLYELYYDAKAAQQRKAEAEEATKRIQTTPTFSPALGPAAAPTGAASTTDAGHFGAGGFRGYFAAPGQDRGLAPGVRKRRWYLGIQSKKDPAHVMTEVFRALREGDFEWKILAPYRIRCRWAPPSMHGRPDSEYNVKIALQLYKVQRGIYLLDLQKVSGDGFTFMNLCARIITELKVPATSAPMPAPSTPDSSSAGSAPSAFTAAAMAQASTAPPRHHRGVAPPLPPTVSGGHGGGSEDAEMT